MAGDLPNLVAMTDTTAKKHVLPANAVGCPYADAGVTPQGCTSTCPVCGEVFIAPTAAAAVAAYGAHFVEAAAADAQSATNQRLAQADAARSIR